MHSKASFQLGDRLLTHSPARPMCNIKFTSAAAAITFPTIPSSHVSPTPITASTIQPSPLMTHQAAATLLTSPTCLIPTPPTITPTTTPNTRASPLTTYLHSPSSTCTTAWPTSSHSKQALSTQGRVNLRGSGGPSRLNGNENTSLHRKLVYALGV
jgi:hypothetical protein